MTQLNYLTGHAVSRRRTAPQPNSNIDKVNPGSVITVRRG